MSDSDKSRVSRNVGAGKRQVRSSLARESLVDTQAARRRHGVGRDQETEAPDWEREPEGAKDGKRRRGWAPVAALAALGTVAVVVAIILNAGGDPAAAGGEAPARPVKEITPAPDVPELTAREVAEAFLGAATLEERMPWVRERPGLMDRVGRFPEETTAYPVEYEQLMPMPMVRTVEGQEFARFAVRMKRGGMRLLCVVSTEAGFGVDWESFARYSSAGWDELNAGRVPEAEVRVFVNPVDYYLFGYADDSRWESFALTSPDWPETLYGYAVRGSTTATLLGRSERNEETVVRVSLLVRPGVEAGRKQIEVARVLAGSWVAGEGDFEAAFEKSQNPEAK